VQAFEIYGGVPIRNMYATAAPSGELHTEVRGLIWHPVAFELRCTIARNPEAQ
jgi:hypothetical protein